jgi:hypothetical protein
MVPTASMETQCIFCLGKDKLEHLGNIRTVAVWQSHAICCEAKKHVICSKCADKSIGNMDIESELKKVGVGRVRRFLDAFRAYAALSPDTLDDKNLNILCGLRRDQLNSIAELSKESKEKVFQLFVFLRLGVGQRPVAALLGKNQSTVSRQFNDTLPKVEKVMAAKYLRQSRATILSGVSALVKALFPELFAAIDGTYHEVEKSQRMMEQLKSWNKQKGYNLLKTLTLITADGKWWDFLGLFYSDGAHNDEMMWEYAYSHDLAGFRTILTATDLIMCDRCPSLRPLLILLLPSETVLAGSTDARTRVP